MRPLVHLLRLRGFPILRQLQLEEALLRVDKDRNWWILNDGSDTQPTIVLGISGKPDQLVHRHAAAEANVPLVKRYSGGGTVIVDNDTILSTFIMKGKDVPHVERFPQPIMQWSGGVYDPVFSKYGDFRVRENDYVLGDTKFGGNAQAITKDRWVHHTSFLWDFNPERMALLKHPAKKPAYRQERDHLDFLCTLQQHTSDREGLLISMMDAVRQAGFDIKPASLEEASSLLETKHFNSTRLLPTIDTDPKTTP